MPIRLWSTVMNHESAPVIERGRRSTGSRRAGGAGTTSSVSGSRTVVIAVLLSGVPLSRLPLSRTQSLEGLQVGEELGDLVFGQLDRQDHLVAGLGLLRIAQPLAEVVGRHLVDRAAERLAHVEMGQVGTDLAG